jgi:hypothetical protein
MNSTDLDQGSNMIIFESILTTFEVSIIFFEAAGGVTKVGSSLKLNHHIGKFSLPKPLKSSVQ